jgi:hypothetical protein
VLRAVRERGRDQTVIVRVANDGGSSVAGASTMRGTAGGRHGKRRSSRWAGRGRFRAVH